jgi:hypothetical protein
MRRERHSTLLHGAALPCWFVLSRVTWRPWQLNFAQHVKSVVVPDNVLFVGGAAPRIPLLLPCGIRPRFHEHEGKDVPHESVIARIVGHEDEPMIECGCGDEAVVDQ